MDVEQLVRVVEVRGAVSGMDAVARGYDQVASSSDDATASLAKSGSEAAIAEAAINKLGRQLQDNFKQQQQFNDMVSQQAAANDNSSHSFTVMGLEVAQVANHLRTAGEAAYAFSPAFRGVVNEMAKPALGFAATALAATAAGIVTATNVAGKGLIEVGLAAARSSSALAPLGGSIAMAGAAMASFEPSIAGVAGSIVSKLLPALRLLGAVTLVVDAARMVGEAWHLGGQKLEEYRAIAEKAAAADLSTQYFQRITKAATEAKLPVDDLTASFKKFTEVSAPKLGGSDLQNRLDASIKAGNFQGNTGVDQLASANTTEQKFRAIVALVDQAMAKGERLAALDLTSKFLSPAAQTALTKDSEYLHNMQASADKIAATSLVSDADIGRALDMQNRWDAAVAILEQRWHPLQDLLTAAGIGMRDIWINIVSSIASAVDWAARLISKLGEVPSWFQDKLNRGATAFMEATTTPESRKASEQSLGISSDPADIAATAAANKYTEAVGRLAAGLKNVNAVQQAVAQTNAVQDSVWKDTSHAIDTAAKSLTDTRDAYDRARDAAQKHYGQVNADTDAIGLGARALAEFQTKSALMVAAMIAEREITPQLTAEIDAYAKAAGVAAEANARMKLASQIDFAGKTKFLSADDVAIANQLKGIYGDDVPAALASTEAAQMRVTAAQKLMSDGFQDVGKAIFSAFLSGKNVMDAMVQSLDAVAKKLADKSFENILSGIMSGDPVQAAIGVAQAGASALISAFTGDQKAKKALQDAQAAWAAMSGQVINFNLAAKGFNLGPLTNEIQSLLASYTSIQHAALLAHDQAGADASSITFQQGVNRVLAEFHAGTPILSPLQKSIKDLNDEAAGLQATLADLHDYSLIPLVGEDLKNRMAQLLQQYQDTLVGSLTARLNTAGGKSYLNDAAALLTQHQQDLSDAAALGNSPALLAQISATFQAEAQKIVEDAGLVGDGFSDFTKLFPAFAGVVTQSATALAAANDKFAALAKTINDYLSSLQFGANSTLSPEAQLGAAQSGFNSQFALAKGGNADALGSITQYASTYLDQAKGFYASSAGYTDIYNAVTSALQSLIGNSSYTSSSAGSASLTSSSLTGSPTGGVTMPQLAQAASSPASNDNGQYFATQTQTLVQAIGAAASAEIAALQDGIEALKSRLDRIAVAAESNKPKAPRPNSRDAA